MAAYRRCPADLRPKRRQMQRGPSAPACRQVRNLTRQVCDDFGQVDARPWLSARTTQRRQQRYAQTRPHRRPPLARPRPQRAPTSGAADHRVDGGGAQRPGARRAARPASDEERALAFAKAIARIAVSDWEGVGDAEGTPVPISPEGIDALLEVWPIFEVFQAAYVAHGLLLDAEKNVSAPSPTGTSAGATATAPRAVTRARTARHG